MPMLALRLTILLCCVIVLFVPLPAAAQDTLLYVNRDYRFAVIFPGDPMARDLVYRTASGASVPAREFFFENDQGRYAVTVALFATGRSADSRLVEQAAEDLRRRGMVLFQASADYDPGIPGRQLNIMERNGRQLRASIYMYDRHLFIAEASAAPGDIAALQFEQSIMLLDEDGNELDIDGLAAVVGFIGSLIGALLPGP